MSKFNPAPRAIWRDRTTPPHILTLVLIAALGALNMNMFIPSLPSMARYFETDYAIMQLAVSAYLGVTALLQLVVGPLSDRYGRRPVLLVALVIFLFATIGCLLAPNIESFLAFRMIQAGVAAGMVLSRAIVRDIVDTARAASMIGYVTMGMSVAPMIGPLFGGYLDEVLGWQAIFVTMLIAGVGVLAICWTDLGETNRNKSSSFGAQFRAYPQLISSRRFWGYTLTAGFSSGAFFAFLGGGPYVASVVLGMSPSELGMFFGLISLGYMMGNFLSGRFSQMMGINRMMLTGSITTVTGILLSMTLFGAGWQHPLALFAPMIVVGLGNGMTLPSANAGMVSVRPELAGSASGLGGALTIGGGATLAAIAGALLSPETGPWPLLVIMLASAGSGVLGTLYVIWVARRAGSIGDF